MSDTGTTTPAPDQSLADIVKANQAAAQQQNIPPYLGSVAEGYVAPWKYASNFGRLEPGRAVYGPQPTVTQPFSTHVNAAGYASLQQPAAGPAQPQGVKPFYRQGDQTRIFAGLSPEATFQLKQKLVDAGLASKTVLSSGGFWDQGSANAMTDVLSYANVRGLQWEDAVDQLAAESSTHPAPRDLLPPQVISTKSAVDLRQTADTVAQQTLGRKLTKAEQARFVSAWQTADLDYQRKQADITLAYQSAQQDINQGGTAPANLPPQVTSMVAPPSPENAAKEAFQNTPEAGAKSIADTFDDFKKILGGIV